jgi:hypothetical protein
MSWQEQELLWQFLVDEEIMLLLTSLKDKRNAGNKIFSNVDISKKPTVLKIT